MSDTPPQVPGPSAAQPPPVQPPSPEPESPPRCYVHQDRLAGSVCRRCGRPICPDCMHSAPVGWQCTNCLKQGHRTSPTIRWRPRAAGRLGQTRMTPVVATLIAINVAVFAWEESNFTRNVLRFEMWPHKVHYGHQWYRLITSAFLHANFEHILLNMFTLAIIGPAVEAELGRVRFLAVYFVAAIGGSMGAYLLSPVNEGGIGASGAIFGIMGAYYVLARSRRWQVNQIATLLVINLIFSFAVPGISWQAHLGGLLSGAAVCWGLDRVYDGRRSAAGVDVVASSAVVVAAVVVLGLLLLVPPGHVNL